MTVTLRVAVDLLRKWQAHHRAAVQGRMCDSFNECDDMDTETANLLRRYRAQTRSAPRPNRRGRRSEPAGGA